MDFSTCPFPVAAAQRVTLQGILNDLLRLDPALAHSLVYERHVVSESYADHPVLLVGEDVEGTPSTSALGVINSLLSVYGHRVVARCDGDVLTHFSVQ